jgi:hypothetical protein
LILLLFRSVECCIARLASRLKEIRQLRWVGIHPLTASTFLDSEFNQLALPSARFAIAPAFQSLRQPGCPVNVEPVLQSRWFYKWLHWKDRLKDSGGNHSPVVDHFGM